MVFVFYFLVFVFCTQLLIRIALIIYYSTVQKKYENNSLYNSRDWTIIQPILSGDPALHTCLLSNAKKTTKEQLIWVIDDNDKGAINIINKITHEVSAVKKRLKVLPVHVPNGVSPKMFKVRHALLFARKNCLILDDDCTIDSNTLKRMSYYVERGNTLVTALPWYSSGRSIYDRLIQGFVNAHALLLYISNAALFKPQTINGMCYATQKKLLSNDLMDEIIPFICDDIAISNAARKRKIDIIQSIIPCTLTITLTTRAQFSTIMHRWLTLSFVFLSKQSLFYSLFFVILPLILPLILLFFSFFLGINFIMIYLTLLTGVYFFLALFRMNILSRSESIGTVFWTIIASLILPLQCLYSVYLGPMVFWRGKKLNLKKEIYYSI